MWGEAGRPSIDLESLARLCVRHPTSTYPELLARLATHGRLRSAELLERARSGLGAGPAAPPDGPWDAGALCWFALVRAALPGPDSTVADVAALVELAHLASGRRGLSERFRGLWLDALFLSGDTARYPYPRPEGDTTGPEWRVRVDELNPYLGAAPTGGKDAGPTAGPDPVRVARWLTEFNRAFTDHGLAPVVLREGAGPPLHRIVAPAQAGGTGEEPLVTVIMPMFEPTADVRASLDSVLRQSWTNLEILMCDDGSGPATGRLLDECAATDSRVRVVRNPRNEGTYPVRNLGLTVARGEFVAFQDADDWSHPERIRRQVEPMLAVPGTLATISRMIRVDPCLGLTVLGYPAESANASSLVFRRVPVLERLGGFDHVRRSGDNEFTGRLRAVFGPRSLLRMSEVLAFLQRTPDSLSRADMRLLFTHPAREHYRFCYREWHGRIAQGLESPFVLPQQHIPSPALERISGVPAPAQRADVVLVGGFPPATPAAPDLTAEVVALRSGGAAVGLLHLPSPTDLAVPARRPPGDLVHLIRTGDIDWFLPEQPVRTALAVIRDPWSVPYLEEVLARTTSDTVLLVADEEAAGRYDPAWVEAALARSTRRIRWLPGTSSVAASLTARVPRSHVLAPRAWATVSPAEPTRWTGTPEALVGVLPPSRGIPPGRVSAWAARTLPRDPDTRVWSRTGGARLEASLGRSVRSLGHLGIDTEGFLRRVPYLSVPPAPGRAPRLEREVVRALAHGCVVFLDPGYREHFGAAALYPDERTVDEWIALHLRRPDLYREQQACAATFLQTTLGPEALQDTVRSLLSPADGR